jgi:hypothetical protein
MMGLPVASCHYLYVKATHSPILPVLKHRQSVPFLSKDRPSITPIQCLYEIAHCRLVAVTTASRDVRKDGLKPFNESHLTTLPETSAQKLDSSQIMNKQTNKQTP